MTSSYRSTGKVVVALLLAVVALAVAGCSVTTDDLPSVRGGVGDGYPLSVHFRSALNLPTGADVVVAGQRVGEVTSLTVEPQYVDVGVRVRLGVPIPDDTRAVIRQNTLLGDTYIALVRPNPDAPAVRPDMRSGDIIPVERTASPPQLEDTLAVLANFVNGGSVQQIQDAMTRINTVMPQQKDLRRLAFVGARDLEDLGRNTGEIDRFLYALNSTGATMDAKSSDLSEMFGDRAVLYWRRVADSHLRHIAYLLPSIGSIFEGGMWMVPMLNSLEKASTDGRDVWDSGPRLVIGLSDFLRNAVVPFMQNPAVDVSSVTTSNGDQVVSDVETLLRMLGAVK